MRNVPLPVLMKMIPAEKVDEISDKLARIKIIAYRDFLKNDDLQELKQLMINIENSFEKCRINIEDTLEHAGMCTLCGVETATTSVYMSPQDAENDYSDIAVCEECGQGKIKA